MLSLLAIAIGLVVLLSSSDMLFHHLNQHLKHCRLQRIIKSIESLAGVFLSHLCQLLPVDLVLFLQCSAGLQPPGRDFFAPILTLSKLLPIAIHPGRTLLATAPLFLASSLFYSSSHQASSGSSPQRPRAQRGRSPRGSAWQSPARRPSLEYS